MRVFRVLIILCAMITMGNGCSRKDPADSAGAAMTVPVRVAGAVEKALDDKITVVATIAASESVDIVAETDGRVEIIGFDEGQSVTNGQMLFQLDQAKMAASLAQAEANLSLAETNFKRSEALLANNTISKQEFDQASSAFALNRATVELTRRQFEDTLIIAPFDGIMGTRFVSPGQVINKNTRLSSIVNIDPAKVEFKVPERYVGALMTGQAVSIKTQAYPNDIFEGSVFFVDPSLDTDTRTVLVKAAVKNADSRLKPGMFGTLDLTLHVRDKAVVIPESALILRGDSAFVWTVDAGGVVGMAPVDVGIRLHGEVEITKGLSGTDTVIIEGTQKVGPGSRVIAVSEDKVAETSMPDLEQGEAGK